MNTIKSITQKDRYGNMFSLEMFEDQGIPMMMIIPEVANGFNGADSSNHPGEPKGTDTVPAWLTPGENVVNAEASRLPGNQEKIDEMNEQGREIQAAQGGPIPTYAADGKKITKRKMPNGKMGLWRGNTYLGMDESSSFLGDISEAAKEGWEEWNPFNSDGGSVPAMYAAGGSQIPRPDGMLNSLSNKLSARDGGPMYSAIGTEEDDTLRKFLQMAEGKKNEAYLDSAGIPTIGYGNTYGVQMGDKISDVEANQRLMRDMAVANEDYNKLVTADLNPNQQAAVKSLLFNIGGPQFANSKARAALNAGDFDAFQKEASEFRMANGKVLPGLESRRAKEMSLFNLPYETRNVGPDAFGVNRRQVATVPTPTTEPPKPYVEDFGDPESTTITPYDPYATVEESQAAESAALDVMTTGTRAANATVTAENEKAKLQKMISDGANPRLISRQTTIAKAAADNAKEAVKANKEALTKQEQSNIADAEKQEKAMEEAMKIARMEPPKPGYDFEATGEDLSPADQAAADKAKAAEDLAKNNPATKNVTQPPGEVDEAGQQILTEDPTFAESIKQGFKDLFSEMFEPKEIARMIVNYAGSRALGYDHSTSLNYSAQTYTKTITADLAARKKFITNKDNLENYTAKSLKRYQETGDIGVLESKGGSAPNYNQTSGNAFIKGIGVVQKFKDSKSGVEAVEYNGQLIPVTDPRIIDIIEPWNEGVYGVSATKKDFLDFAKGHGSYLNNDAGLKAGTKNDTSYDDRVDFPEEKIAEEANIRFREILKQNGASVRDIPDLMNDVNSAISRYMEDTIAHKQKRRNTKPISIRAYINDSTIQALTDVPQSQIGATSVNNTNELNKRIKDSMKIKNTKDPRYAEDYYNQWQSTYQAYRSLPLDVKNKFVADAAKRIADNPKDETKHYSGFTLWASKTSDSEVAKIISELKSAGKL